MLKLLLCSVFITPCLIFPFIGSASSEMISFDKTSFDEAYIEPEFDLLGNCETAVLDVFFHEKYITMHSAQYISEGLKLSKECQNANYVITPIIPTTSHVAQDIIVETRTAELADVLEAHGVNAVIGKATHQKDFDSLSANGRTATLKIVFSQSGST